MLGDLLFDLVHYANKVAPSQTNSRWPIGATLRLNNTSLKKCDVPLTVGIRIREFVANDGFKTNLPLFRPVGDEKAKLLNEVWKSSVGINSAPVCPLGLPDHSFTGDVCISTVEHDNSQLIWNRPNIPLCDYGDECEGKPLSLVGYQSLNFTKFTSPKFTKFPILALILPIIFFSSLPHRKQWTPRRLPHPSPTIPLRHRRNSPNRTSLLLIMHSSRRSRHAPRLFRVLIVQ